VSLGGLCSTLGAELLDVALAPQGLDVPVAGVALHDTLDPPGTGLASGDIVIGIGVECDDDGAISLLDAAGRIGVSAVVCKRRGDPSGRLINAAQEAGVALLTTDPDVPWAELYDLLRASLAADVTVDVSRSASAMTGGLVALADSTAATAGGPVTIEDMSGRLLAFSQHDLDVDAVRVETILSRRVPEERMRQLRRTGFLDRVRESDEVLELVTPGAEPRRVIAIRCVHGVLGLIWLAGSHETLSPRADATLREAAHIAAVHLMSQRACEGIEKRVRDGMLRMLFRGDGLPDPMLVRLGFAPDRDRVVVAVAGNELTSALGDHQRLVSMIVEHLRAYRWRASAAALDGRVYVLVEMHEGADREALRRTLADCIMRAGRALGARLRAGIGETVPAGEALASGRRGADQCVDLGCERDDVVPFEDIHGRALLADAQAFLAGQRVAVAPGLRRLLDHDREHGSDYVASLRAYLDEFGDAAAAAARVRVHVNTLRYRLRRIAELSATDLTDADARLSLELQLRALSNGSAGAAPQH
jgi:hypothetical protein